MLTQLNDIYVALGGDELTAHRAFVNIGFGYNLVPEFLRNSLEIYSI